MFTTVKATVRNGKIELVEKVDLPEGASVLVTLLPNDATFWVEASQTSLDSVWNNTEDDVYACLLDE